jgi:hypothetical protein
MLGAAKDERCALFRLLEQPYQRLELVFAVDFHHEVVDVGSLPSA